jgi:hypothetical protein
MPASLQSLPSEVLHSILSDVEISPADLFSISRVCRALRSYVKADKTLHRTVYLRHLVGFSLARILACCSCD